jgi:hypothetical protein
MAKFIKLNIGDKDYFLGFPTRLSVRRAEQHGLDITKIKGVLSIADNVFYTALLEKQPKMTAKEADGLIDLLMEEGKYDYNEIIAELTNEVTLFYKTQEGQKKYETFETVEM